MIFSNPYIMVPLVTWAVAQLLKFSLAAWRRGFDLRLLYASGGMPSAHTAVVVALAVTAAAVAGTSSAVFGLAAVLAAIVTYDSLGVRRSSGEQVTVLNQVLDHLMAQRSGWTDRRRLREVLGHQPIEVAAGAGLGLVIGALFNADHLNTQATWLSQHPDHLELVVAAALAAVILVIGGGGSWWIRQRYRRSASRKRVAGAVLVMALSTGAVGLILSFAAYQHALYVGWRLWLYLWLLVGLVWAGILVRQYHSWLPEQLAEEAARQRRARWLPRRRGR